MQITYKREDFEILQGIPVDVVRFSDLGTSQGCTCLVAFSFFSFSIITREAL